MARLPAENPRLLTSYGQREIWPANRQLYQNVDPLWQGGLEAISAQRQHLAESALDSSARCDFTHRSSVVWKLSRAHFIDVRFRKLSHAIQRGLQLNLIAINVRVAGGARDFDEFSKTHQHPRKRLGNNQAIPRIQYPRLVDGHVKHG